METIRLNAVETSLIAAQRFVAERAEREGMPPARIARLELVTEEIFVNQVRYAYRNRGGEVEIRCLVREGMFCAEFIDSGPPFDPLAQPPPDTAAPLIERSIGGLGIELVRRLADTAEYRREAGANVFRVCMRIASPAS